MKKFLFLLTLCLTCAVFTGCSSTEISCGVDSEHNAYIKLNIAADLSDFSDEDAGAISQGLYNLTTDYELYRDFKTDYDFDSISKNLTVEMELIKSAETDEEAFGLLKTMLTDETSTPFTELEISGNNGEYEQAYKFHGTINAEKILTTAHLDTLDPELREFFEACIKSSTVNFILELPSTEVVESSAMATNTKGKAIMTVPVSFDNPTEINLVTRACIINGKISDITLNSTIDNLEARRTNIVYVAIIFTALAACILISAYVLFTKRVKK